MIRLFDSLSPVARMLISLPGVKPSLRSARLVANSMPVPRRLIPTVFPRNSCTGRDPRMGHQLPAARTERPDDSH